LQAALAACAAELCQEVCWRLPEDDWRRTTLEPPTPHRLVVAHDGAAPAAAFADSAVRTILRMGGRVILLGAVSAACFEFAVDHLQAAGGVFVSSGGSPAWLQFEVVGPQARPWSSPGSLERAMRRLEQGTGRRLRTAGPLRSFRAELPYRASLVKHLQETRPFTFGLQGLSPAALADGAALQTHTRSRLLPVAGPVHWRDGAPLPSSLQPLIQAIRVGGWAGGFAFDPTGRLFAVLDERGQLAPAPAVFEALAALHGRDAPAGRSAVLIPDQAGWCSVSAADRRLLPPAPPPEQVVARILETDALLAADGQGRWWIRDGIPRCDPWLAAAAMLRWRSEFDRELSVLRTGPGLRPGAWHDSRAA
jgi:hypothetical protein